MNTAFQHPQYVDRGTWLDYDMALVRTSAAMKYDAFTQAAQLPRRRPNLRVPAWMAGWGALFGEYQHLVIVYCILALLNK